MIQVVACFPANPPASRSSYTKFTLLSIACNSMSSNPSSHAPSLTNSSRNNHRHGEAASASGEVHSDSDEGIALPTSNPHPTINFSVDAVRTGATKRSRGVRGTIDPDSDADQEIEAGLHISGSSGRATTTYETFHTKRLKADAPMDAATQPMNTSLISQQLEEESLLDEKKRKQVRYRDTFTLKYE
jgi:hypothetical protein